MDLQSGRIVTGAEPSTGSGPPTTTLHPETGAPLVGETLPMWDAVLRLAHTLRADLRSRCATSRWTSPSPRTGPVLIEINTGGGFDLPQLASGEGFLTDEVREFFRACGYEKL